MSAGSEIATRILRESDELDTAKAAVGAILADLRDWQAKALLHGALVYGWREPNGGWRSLGAYKGEAE